MIHIQRVNFKLQIDAVCMFSAAKETTEQIMLCSHVRITISMHSTTQCTTSQRSSHAHACDTFTTGGVPTRAFKSMIHPVTGLALGRDRSHQIGGQEHV